MLSCGRTSGVKDPAKKEIESQQSEAGDESLGNPPASAGDWVLSKNTDDQFSLSHEQLEATITGAIVWENSGKTKFYIESIAKGKSGISLEKGDVLFGVGTRDQSAIFFDLDSKTESFIINPECPTSDLGITGYSFSKTDDLAYYTKNISSLTASDKSLYSLLSTSLAEKNFVDSEDISLGSCDLGIFKGTSQGKIILGRSGFSIGVDSGKLFYAAPNTPILDYDFQSSYGTAYLNNDASYPAELSVVGFEDGVLRIAIASYDHKLNSTTADFVANLIVDTNNKFSGDSLFSTSATTDMHTDGICSFVSLNLENVSSFFSSVAETSKNDSAILCSFTVYDNTPSDMSDNVVGLFVGFRNQP